MQRLGFWIVGLFLGVLLTTPLHAEVWRPFDIRFQDNINGNIVYAGNTLMQPAEFSGSEPPLTANNDRLDMQYINVDGNPETNKSSRSLLDIQESSRVVYAALYWGGRLNDMHQHGSTVLLAVPGQDYVSVNAEWLESPANNNYYAGFAEVTDLVRKGGRGVYTVANVGAQTGLDRFAGWALVVVEENDVFPFRNITLFDGYASIPDQVDIKVEGFMTPRRGEFNASLGVVAYEGDYGHDGAQFLLNGVPLEDASRDPGNFFASRFTRYGELFMKREPAFTNLMGFDIAEVDITGWLDNAAESATLSFTTDRDWYQPTAVSFMADFNIDLSLNLSLHYPDYLKIGDTLTLETQVTNQGQEPYEEVTVILNIPEGTRYIKNSTSLDRQPLTDARDGDFAHKVNDRQIQVTVPRLRPDESRTLRYEVVLEDSDRLKEKVRIQNSAVFIVPELGSEALVLSDSDIDRAGIQPSWLLPLHLQAPNEVTEGQTYQVTAVLGEVMESPLRLELNQGGVMEWRDGQVETAKELPGPPADVYQTDITITHYVDRILSPLRVQHPVVLKGARGQAKVIKVKDDPVTTHLTLSASDVYEGSRGVLITAEAEYPAKTDMQVTLDQGETLTIAAGQTRSQLRLPVRENDVYISESRFERHVVETEGGSFQQVDYSGAAVNVRVMDRIDTTYLSLEAPESVYEGGTITYTVRVTHPPRTDLNIKLSDGQLITIAPGETRAELTLPAPENTPYLSAHTREVSVVDMQGGNYERLVGAEDVDSLLARTHVKDRIDVTRVFLETEDAKETDDFVRFTARLENPAKTETLLILDLGEEILIQPGESTGYVDLPLAKNSVYLSEYMVRRTVVDVKGGGFESLDYQHVGAVAQVRDVIDTVLVNLEAPKIVDEGSSINFVATVKEPPLTDLTLTLSNGASLVIRAGETRGSTTYQAPPNTPYLSAQDIEVTIKSLRGGQFEDLRIGKGAPDEPLVIHVQNVVDTTQVELVTSDVTENDENLVFTALFSNTAKTEVLVTLDGGEVIRVAPGENSGFTTVEKRNPDVYISESQVKRKIVAIEGGLYEEVDYSQARATARVTDVIDTTTLALTADETVNEGKSFTYRARVNNPPLTDLQIELNSGDMLVIPAGESSASLTVAAPENDVYLSAHNLHRFVSKVSGGRYERLEVAQGSQEQPLRIRVTDIIDVTRIELAAQDVFEGSEGVLLQLTLEHPARTEARATLVTGEELIIPEGESQTELRIPVRKRDVYRNQEKSTWEVKNFSGGDFEQVDFTQAVASAWIRDVIDTVEARLLADESAVEGGWITYSVKVGEPPETQLRLTLSNQEEIVLEPGQLERQIRVKAPANDPYLNDRQVEASIQSFSGGNYERLVISQGHPSDPQVTRILDTPDTTWVDLVALNVDEQQEEVVFKAFLSEPARSAVTITLDGGEKIEVAPGDRFGQVSLPIRQADVYINSETLTRKVVEVNGGDFERVNFQKAQVEVTVYDAHLPTQLILSADEEVMEGGEITYSGRLDHLPRSPVEVRLSNGAQLNFAAGEQVASVVVPAPEDTVYQDAHELAVYVVTARGGDFANLQLKNGTQKAPLITHVLDVPTPVLLQLYAEDIYENEKQLKVTAQLSSAPATETRIALNTGDEILFSPGQSIASVHIQIRDNDVYRNPSEVTFAVLGVTGGNFEQVNYEHASAKVRIVDTGDPVLVSLKAPAKVNAGEVMTYSAVLSAAPQQGVAIGLSNGKQINIPAGQQEASIQVMASAVTPYQVVSNIEVTVTHVVGGNFERLILNPEHFQKPLITEIIQPKQPVTLSLTSIAVADRAVFEVNLDAPAASPVNVTLTSGQTIQIPAGAVSSSLMVSKEDLNGTAVSSVEIRQAVGGRFRELVW